MSKGDVKRLSENLKRHLTVSELDGLAYKMGFSLRGRKDEKALILSELLLDSGVDRRRKNEDRDYQQSIFSFVTKGPGSLPQSTFNSNAVKDKDLNEILYTIANTAKPQIINDSTDTEYEIFYIYPKNIEITLQYETQNNTSKSLKGTYLFMIQKDGQIIFYVNGDVNTDISSDSSYPLSGTVNFSGNLSDSYTFILKTIVPFQGKPCACGDGSSNIYGVCSIRDAPTIAFFDGVEQVNGQRNAYCANPPTDPTQLAGRRAISINSDGSAWVYKQTDANNVNAFKKSCPYKSSVCY